MGHCSHHSFVTSLAYPIWASIRLSGMKQNPLSENISHINLIFFRPYCSQLSYSLIFLTSYCMFADVGILLEWDISHRVTEASGNRFGMENDVFVGIVAVVHQEHCQACVSGGLWDFPTTGGLEADSWRTDGNNATTRLLYRRFTNLSQEDAWAKWRR